MHGRVSAPARLLYAPNLRADRVDDYLRLFAGAYIPPRSDQRSFVRRCGRKKELHSEDCCLLQLVSADELGVVHNTRIAG